MRPTIDVVSGPDPIGTIDTEEANRVVRAHMAEFREYRSRLAAVAVPADATPGQRESTGRIEPKPAAPKPEAQDQVRLSKVEPQKPGATAAARGDDAVARQRALQEAQSRIKDLEKNVADLHSVKSNVTVPDVPSMCTRRLCMRERKPCSPSNGANRSET